MIHEPGRMQDAATATDPRIEPALERRSIDTQWVDPSPLPPSLDEAVGDVESPEEEEDSIISVASRRTDQQLTVQIVLFESNLFFLGIVVPYR